MILMLDDIGAATYKKLKVQADSLVKLGVAIKYKQQLASVLLEQWLEEEKLELDDAADITFYKKHKLDIEISELQKQENSVRQRITSYVKSKTRIA